LVTITIQLKEPTMTAIAPGRWTHEHRGEVVVFLIGMRVNRPLAVRTWWPVFAAMPRMIRELYADPSLGLLGHTATVNGRGALMVQYWRDLDSLLAYAQDVEHSHRPAWRDFNASARRAAGVVGIWHETYTVAAGGHESLYVDMPSQGLPKAVGAEQVGHALDGARQRISRGR
jgi:Domain of unknown function (DUF4188)